MIHSTNFFADRNPIRCRNQARKVAATGTVIDSFGGTTTTPVLSFSCRSNKRDTVTGKSQRTRMNKLFRNRLPKEFLMKKVKQGTIRLSRNGERSIFQFL